MNEDLENKLDEINDRLEKIESILENGHVEQLYQLIQNIYNKIKTLR